MLLGWVAQPRFARILQGTESESCRNFSMAAISAEVFGKLNWWAKAVEGWPPASFWSMQQNRHQWHYNSKLHTIYYHDPMVHTWLSGRFKPENGFTSSSLCLFRPVILSDMITESSHEPTGKPGMNSLPWLSANPSFSALFCVLFLFPISALDDINPEE